MQNNTIIINYGSGIIDCRNGNIKSLENLVKKYDNNYSKKILKDFCKHSNISKNFFWSHINRNVNKKYLKLKIKKLYYNLKMVKIF